MPRWSKQEQELLLEIRTRLHDELAAYPQYPEVVGDRKVIRFLRGHSYDVEKVTGMICNFLKWRKDNNVNKIRQDIVEHGLDHPLKFPNGELILELIPHIVICPDSCDSFGAPISVDQYNFSPGSVLSKISIEQYIQFVIYSLEYKSLVVEQMSQEREEQYLCSLSDEERRAAESDDDESPPYGVLVNICVVRDLGGVGLEHLGAKGQELIKAVVTLASDNYPELMRKCYMINTPWVFNTIWFVVKQLLAARTLSKIAVMGSNYLSTVTAEIPMDNLPAMVGGNYKGSVDYEPYKFNRDYLCPTPSCDVDVIAKTEQAEVVTRETNDDLSNGQCDVHDVERDAFIDDNQIVSTEQTHGCLFENTVEGVVETDGVRCGSVSIPINNEESSNNHVSNINDIVASERQEVDPTICVPTQEEVAQRVGVSSISTNRSSGDSTNTSLTNDIISTTVDTDKIKQIKKVRDSKSKPMKSISKTSSQDSLCSEDSYINPDGVVQCTEEQEKEIQETNSTVVIGTVKVVSKSKSTRNYSDYIDALDTIK